jgi:putative copper resistance protein D
VDAALIAVRFSHFSAAMLLLGVTSFAAALAPPELVQARARRVRAWSIGLVVLIATTGTAWLALEAGEAGQGWSDVLTPSMWLAVLAATDFGAVWLWHLAFIVLLVTGLTLPPRARLRFVLAGDILLLLSLGFVGHAAMEQGAVGLAHRLNHALHILSSGFWVGSLLPLAACLGDMRSARLRGPATATLMRFSGLGHLAVAVALLTGLVNTALTLGRLPLDWRSPYQALFAAKLAVVLLMLTIALFNRYALTPQLASKPARAQRGLVVGTLAELGLGAVVIALISAFATLDPV